VVLSSIGSTSFLINLILYLIYFFPHHDLSTPMPGLALQLVNSSCDLFLATTCGVHCLLVYARTKVVFQTSVWFVRVMKSFVIGYFMFVVLAIFSGIIHGIFMSAQVFNFFYKGFAVCSAGCLGVVDVASTVSFARHVRQVNSALVRDNVLIGKCVHVRQTDLIAKRGVRTCFAASMGLLFFLVFNYFKDNDQTIADWFFMLYQIQMVITMILWMQMKIELRQIAAMNEASEPTVELTKQSSESKFSSLKFTSSSSS